MNSVFLVSFIGKASPNLIKELAHITHEQGGKWLVSKVNYVDDTVAAVIKVELPSENCDTVKAAFSEQATLTVQFTDLASAELATLPEVSFRVDAQDRPGIVREISHILDERNIEVIDMDCHRFGLGAIAGTMFTAQVSVKMPADITAQDMANDIEALSQGTIVKLQPKQ
ncbi:hypothetical protein VST7929_01217 [Vibrio stylophorae]|uniref:Glycine cleavage system transcriptional repressor n=1 Tax=Vibrio stylophorae TaxID=659351 RepID=A0ABM8ZSR2_9VIBR|nr:ACT domain-containing protein [Vibrio stylophorae]CAH0533351.1 hypothetical protein VST7929_01217 [Vibrio stylophorae]